jgi:hypothetical protein
MEAELDAMGFIVDTSKRLLESLNEMAIHGGRVGLT